MKKNTLLFHIGIPKTGTTAIQKYLYSSQEQLEKWGWFYPSFGNTTAPHVNGYFLVNHPCKQAIDRHESRQWEEIWETVCKCLTKGNVIISNEDFWDKDVLTVYRYAVEQGINVKIIVYLRRQDLYLESHYNECVKIRFEKEPFSDWVKINALENDLAHAHYLNLLQKIEAIVGSENIIVKIFEKEQMYQGKMDIVNDFIHTIIPTFDETISVENVNERLLPDIHELKRLFNSVAVANEYIVDRYDYHQFFLQLSSMHVDSNMDKKAGYMTKNARQELMKLYEEENGEIARRYLKRNEGVLFVDQEYDKPQVQLKLTPNEQLIIEYISEVYMQLNRKINSIMEMYTSEDSFVVEIDRLRGERQIILFGAGIKCGLYQNKLHNKIEFIIDNDPSKWGMKLRGKNVCSIETVDDLKKYFIVITVACSEKIEEQLQNYGLKRQKDYVIGNEYNL